MSDAPGASERAATTSLGALFGDVSRSLSELFRQEVELAKAELKESATKAGKGAGLLGGAGVAGHLAVLFLSIAVWWGLGEWIGRGWSALVVALLYGVIALILALVGRARLREVRGMPKTAETLTKIPETLKPGDMT